MAATKRAEKPTTTLTATALGDESHRLGPGRRASRDVERDGPTGASPEGITAVVTGTAQAVRAVLPNRLPVYLGAAALLVVGVLEPPVALAAGLAYEALRRWKPTPAA